MENKRAKVKVRATSIINLLHPEWGLWGVMEDTGEWFVIRGNRGSRVLGYDEFDKFWDVVDTSIKKEVKA